MIVILQAILHLSEAGVTRILAIIWPIIVCSGINAIAFRTVRGRGFVVGATRMRLRLTRAFLFLLIIEAVATAIVLPINLIESLPSVDSRDSSLRLRAVSDPEFADQQLLAKIAVEDKNPDVRKSAVQKLTEQATLAKVALGDENPEIRSASVDKLTDQTLLEKLAVDDKYDDVRQAAVPKLTNESVVWKVALEDRNPDVQQFALSVLAMSEKDGWNPNGALAAVEKLTNQPLLRKAAFLSNPVGPAARICLALQDPLVLARIPNSKLTIAATDTYHSYTAAPGVHGQEIIFTIQQGSKTLARDRWSTHFPELLGYNVAFVEAHIDVSAMMRELFSKSEFTQKDLLELTRSPISEVSVAAMENLTVRNGPRIPDH
jgi:hypothetical protein